MRVKCHGKHHNRAIVCASCDGSNTLQYTQAVFWRRYRPNIFVPRCQLDLFRARGDPRRARGRRISGVHHNQKAFRISIAFYWMASTNTVPSQTWQRLWKTSLFFKLPSGGKTEEKKKTRPSWSNIHSQSRLPQNCIETVSWSRC